MVNIIYFNLDDASYSTSSPDSILSQQQDREGSGAAVGEASSASVVVAAREINAWIRPSSWVNREQIGNPDQDLYKLDFSSNTMPFTSPSEGKISHSSNLKSFSFEVLETATKNFSPDCLLGEGGFGIVFKGWIDEYKLTATKPGRGTSVAVKRLIQGSFQGHEEWLAEINYLGQLYHPNLVKLLGYCLDHEELLLVYEFMPRGSLDDHLFRRNSNCQLPWNIRMNIALGAAKALAFLHSAEVNVIHRGCQSSNILLDLNYNGKLSDFGLAKDGPTANKSHVPTRVPYVYAAPEYLATGHLTATSDVFSFGLVLLEMLSGRRARRSLVDWAKPYLNHKHKIFRVLDSRLEGQYSLAGAQKAANLAFHCLSNEAKFRPNMDEVVKALEELQDSEENKKRIPRTIQPTSVVVQSTAEEMQTIHIM